MKEMMKISILFVISLTTAAFGKQTLISEGTFDGDMERSSSPIERNRAAEERINLSFPGEFKKT